MAAHAGEKAHKTGDFLLRPLQREGAVVKQGGTIPPCPNGHKSFKTRRHEPGN